jgi:hypothetical protein
MKEVCLNKTMSDSPFSHIEEEEDKLPIISFSEEA